MQTLTLFHVLATILWVGGMFFAHQCLRPVVLAQLEPPQRLRLWNGVFGRFFPWVWGAVATLIGTGQVMVVQMGGMGAVPLDIHLMVAIGYLMAGIFAFIYFRPYAQLRRAVAAENWPEGGQALNTIRKLVGTNLVLGLINVIQVFLL
ncbi:MAG: CopD family protein [Pseudomonadota bacterium]